MLRAKEEGKGSIEEALTKARRFKETILQEISSKLKIKKITHYTLKEEERMP